MGSNRVMTDDRGPLWLRGEDGGVGLMCRLCDTGGAPVAYWLDPAPEPGDVDKAARGHRGGAHPSEPEAGPGTWLPYPPDGDQALAFARKAPWRFEGYYKYAFTFTASGTLIASDAYQGPRRFAAAATVGGEPGDFYRFSFRADAPETWDSLRYVRTPDLVITDTGGTELIRIEGGD
jgi:hypothetical protein